MKRELRLHAGELFQVFTSCAAELVSSVAVEDASPGMRAFSLKEIANLAERLYVIPFGM